MDTSEALWRLEEQFWLGSANFYSTTLAPNALMVLPQPAGVLDRAATVESIKSGNRWRNVSFEHKRVASVGPDGAVLVYLVHADRGIPDSTYIAQCTSTYLRDRDQWLLVVHHQTPAGDAKYAHA